MELTVKELHGLLAKKPQKGDEAKLQMACVRYWQTKFRPNQDEYYLLYKVHNEGKKSKVQAAKDKALGIVAGAADMNLDLARRGYNGLRIEFKTLSGKQSPKQKIVQAALERNGYLYKVVQTLDEFISLIDWYLSNNNNNI
jgi:hypothetical protein